MASISVITPTIRPAGLEEVRNSLQKQVFTDFEWLVDIGVKKTNDLNASYNRLIRRATGELIVSIQDYTTFGPEFLTELWQTYKEEPNIAWTVDVAHVDVDTVEFDWRHSSKGNTIQFNELEICAGAIPKKILYDVGGFDEELDALTWGFDNVNLGLRIAMKGYEMRVHPTASAQQFKHDTIRKHPYRKYMEPDLHNHRLDQIRRGEVEIDYL
jgi:GT2 family glycosyltransferase